MAKLTDNTFDQNEIIGAFIELLKGNREAKNLSVSELSNKAGISSTVIYDLEKRNVLPKIETINKIANALDLAVEIKTIKTNNLPALSMFYYSKDYARELSSKIGITLTATKSKDTSRKRLRALLIQQGLYQDEVKEVENFINFKLSQH